MKISDDMESDNNSAEVKVMKRVMGRSRGKGRQNINKSSHEKSENGNDDVDQFSFMDTTQNEKDMNFSLASCCSPIVSTTPPVKRRTPATKKRDLMNLQSTLSPKYIGDGTPNTTLDGNDDERGPRPKRMRTNNISNADIVITPITEKSLSERSTPTTPKEFTPQQSNNGNESHNNTGFEADAEDAVAAANERKQVKRKQKRNKSRRLPDENVKTETKMDSELKNATIILEVEKSAVDEPVAAENKGKSNKVKEASTAETDKFETPKESRRRRKRGPKPKTKEKNHKAAVTTENQKLNEKTQDSVPTAVVQKDLSDENEKKDVQNLDRNDVGNDLEEDNCITEKSEKIDVSLIVQEELAAKDSEEPIVEENNNDKNTLQESEEIINKEESTVNALTNPDEKDSNVASKDLIKNIKKENDIFQSPEKNQSKQNDADNITSQVLENAMKSPSTDSLDSAKGSSISTDSASWPQYRTGDLYWGRLFTYCYWPCMVCPDPEGRIVTQAARNYARGEAPIQVQVHVRFFADNGRRNWIKRENLLAFAGLKAYIALRDDVRTKYGSKSAKFQQMMPKRNKIMIWHQAVEESNIIADVPYPERLEKFFSIYENSVTLQKQKRKRRSSMLQAASSTSDVGSSIYDSTDNLYAKQMLHAVKRERSESPFSPAYSPVKGAEYVPKKRKISKEISESQQHDNVRTEPEPEPEQEHHEISTNVPMSSGPQQTEGTAAELLRSKEYNGLFIALKEYVMGPNHDEKLERCLFSAVHNIWSLKQLNKRQMDGQLAKSVSEQELGSAVMESVRGDGSVKRLSNRLRNMIIRRSMTPVTQPAQLVSMENKLIERRPSDSAKPKKIINRPIEEVVNDILNLDRKYLFRGMGRDPVCKYCLKPGENVFRCSKNCNSWLHRDCKIDANVEQNKKQKLSKDIVASSDIATTSSGRESASIESNASSPVPVEEPVPIVNHITGEGEVREELEPIVCKECAENASPTCCICHQENAKITPPNSPLKSPSKGTNEMSEKLVSCNTAFCNKKFHPVCCKYWPQAKISKTSVRCPAHVCHTCVSDDPSGKFQQLGSAKLTKCVKCPATYHMDSTCIPAGTQILTAAHIICPRHNTTKNDVHVNVSWCYICVKGGELVCCETCPIAVHAHCRNIPIKASEGYICEECESGRLPLYGEIVWAKFNNFRWWPAIILPPTEVPTNIMRKSHGASDFVVRFFGTHDHGWISRRRVYLYIEGDAGDAPKTKSSLDQNYTNGVEEASRFLRIIKAKRQEQSIASTSSSKLHPQPYIKIKTNKAVLPVKFHIDLEKVNKCECNPDAENPCGADTGCLNRVLYNECNPKVCRAGQRCQNQMFESRISPRLEVVYMNERGFGLVSREPIKEGDFVIEYVGEVINDAEFRQRILQKTRDRDENFYFLVVEKDYIIDAGPKGNLARFMNHSCEPNCETQKWLVNGINRVGLFAIKDIPANSELTFNYLWDDLMDNPKKVCFCGASKCAGEIGGKYKEDSPKESVTGLKNARSKSSSSAKNKKLKKLKRLQSKKGFKIEVGPPKKGTGSSATGTAGNLRKHISADDTIEDEIIEQKQP